MTCEHCQDLLPAYLTGDLTPDESAAVRGHLAGGCPRCAGAFAEERATIALLAASLDPIQPPRGAKERLIASIRAPRAQDTQTSGPVAPDRSLTVRAAPARRRWLAPLAMAACLAFVAVSGWHLHHRREYDRREATLRRAVADRDARLTQLHSLVAAERLSLIALGGQPSQPNASGRVFWDRDAGRWHVFVFDMKPPPPGREYELWFITPDQKKVPAGTFVVGANGSGEIAVPVPAELGPVAVAAITDEPAGGSPQPTGTIHLVGEVK